MNKKMIVTGMSVLLLVTAGIGIFGNGKLVKAEEVAQKPSEVTITLHKKGLRPYNCVKVKHQKSH